MVAIASPAAVLSIIVEANTGKAEAALKEFQRNLSKADREKAEAELAFQVEKGGYNVFSGLVKKADSMSAEASLGFEVDNASLVKAKAAQAVLTKESSKLSDVFSRSQLSIGQWTGILAASLPVVFDLAGALGALTASLGAATAGLGALGVGIGGVLSVGFGGIAAIAAPAIGSLTDLMTAQESANKAQTTGAASAARAAASSAQQISAAHDQVISAEQQLEQAQASAEIAQESLTQAREDAVRQLLDMRRASVEGATSEKRAQISLRQARADLLKLQRDGSASALDLESAELSVVEARQALRDATISGNRAQKDFNEAQRGGISQMDGVVSAQQSLDSAMQGVEDAHKGVADAVENLANQQKEANAAAGAGATSLAALALAQKKAGPAAVKFAHHLKEMTKEWRRLTAAGREDFFGMLDDGLTRLNRKLPMFADSAEESVRALREAFNRFLDRATGPEFNHFIEVMTNTFAKSVKPLAGAFGNIAKVLQRIAVAVAPDIVRMARAFEEMTEGWVDSTRNARNLRETIHGLVGQTKAWWELLVAAKDLIVAVLVPGMGEGKKAIQEMTGQLKEWTNWANSHPKEIRDFMKEGLKTTKLLAQVLISFIPQLFEIAKATRPIARAFLAITRALNSIKVGNVSVLTGLIGAFVAARFIRGMMAMRATLGLLASGAVARGAAAVRGAAGATAATTVAQAPFGAPMPGPVGAGKAGGTWGQRFGTAARGAMLPIFSGLGVAVAGSFAAQPLLKKFHEIAKKAADDFPKPFGGVGDAIADLAIPDHILPEIPEHPGGILGLLGVGKDAVDKLDELAEGVRGGKQALTGLEKVLDGFSSMTAQEAIDGLRKKYGGLVTAGHEMSKKQREAFVNMARAARENGDITQNQLEQVTNAFDSNSSKWERSMRRAADATGQSTKSIKRTVGDMKVKVSKDYDGMVRATGGGLDLLTSNTSRALVALGVKDQLHFRAVQKTGAIAPHARQRGGHIPGAGEGDKVPAMLEPGEFVVNKKATRAARPMLEDLNRKVPRFAKGGAVGGKLNFALGPYDIPPIQYAADHAGGNSHVHITGTTTPWVVSIGKQLQRMGFMVGEHPAFGGVNAQHSATGGHYDALAIDVNSAADETRAEVARIARLLKTGAAGGAVAKEIKRVLMKGPKGPLKDMGQAALDKVWKAANALIQKKAPTEGGELGASVPTGPIQKMARQMVNKMWGASQWPPFVSLEMAEAGWNPRAVNASSGAAGLAQALPPSKYPPGAWPYQGPRSAKLQLQWMMGYIRDRYGDPASAWSWHQSHNWYKQGGIVAPYVGSFDKGGEVAQTGLGMLHKGEHVVALKEGGFLAGGGGSRPPASGGSGGTRADDRGSRGLGIERIKQIRQRLGKQLSKALPVLDERIDIAERLAGLTSSPAGSELSKGELREQMSLQHKLLDNLRKTLQIAKRGADLAKRTIERLEKHVKKLERKIKVEQRQMEQKVKRLTKFIKDEEGKNKPDREKIAAARERINEVKERHGKPIAKWTEEARKKAQGATKLKPMLPAFRDAIVEMSGLTGRSGRIFDTKLSIKELRAAGKPQPLHIAELLEFAEAMRFGAFRRAAGPDSPAAPLPTFHQGGIVPGLRGQEVQVLARGGEVFQAPGQGAPVVNLEVVLSGGLEALNPHIDVRIREKDRDSRRVHRAGRRP